MADLSRWVQNEDPAWHFLVRSEDLDEIRRLVTEVFREFEATLSWQGDSTIAREPAVIRLVELLGIDWRDVSGR